MKFMSNLTKFNRVTINFIVIDFSQVDYSYPPLFVDKPNESVECPDGWKYLPTLALPDGSHNFAEDTVFFNLPSLNDPRKTVYGISCYVRWFLFALTLEYDINMTSIFLLHFAASNTC